MSEGVTLVIATGIKGSSNPEKVLNRALEANTLDLLDIAGSVSGCERRILITDSDRLIDSCASNDPEVTTERTSRSFHFGKSLFEKIETHNIKNLFYIGGGSAPLFGKRDFDRIVSFLLGSSDVLLTNNFYSTDMIGLSPAQKLLKLEPPKKDNGLGWLARDAGLEPHEMTRNAKTQLDLDTTVDLVPLKLSDRPKNRLKDYLSDQNVSGTRIKEILPQFTDQNSRIIIAGRLGASTWSHLEKSAACHLDVISEGRGSYTKKKRGRKGYWLGKWLEELGPDGFIEWLSKKGTGIFLDTRVLFDYKGKWPSRKDRFSSDLLNFRAVDVDYLRNLTFSARNSPKPVVLGGHSMISGSLYLLSEVAWKLTESKSANIKPRTFELEVTD